MYRITSSPRVAAHFSLAFISVEIRLTSVPPTRAAVVAERTQARADLARTLDRERAQAQTRLLLRG